MGYRRGRIDPRVRRWRNLVETCERRLHVPNGREQWIPQKSITAGELALFSRRKSIASVKMHLRCFVLFYPVLFLNSNLIQAGTLVQFRTTVGDFDVELYDTEKPVTSRNFLRYITNGIYAN